MSKKFVFASLRRGAGKTSAILSFANALPAKKVGYMKPFGDRLLYAKKRLWDYDAALITNLLGLEEEIKPEDITIGFEHSKLRYSYIDEEAVKEKLLEIVAITEKDKDLLFIEAGKDFTYGVSVNLDPISLSKFIDAKLIIIVSGENNAIVDDITFFKKHIDINGAELGGIIINQVKEVEDFNDLHLEEIKKLGVNILGVIPFHKELTQVSVEYIAHVLFAKVLTDQGGMDNLVKHIFIGAMSANSAQRAPSFGKTGKLIITSGDRTDMIVAALESETAAIVVTNDVLPPSNIISLANEKKIPLLLVPVDTFSAAKQVDDMERLLTKNESYKIEILKNLIKENINLELF